MVAPMQRPAALAWGFLALATACTQKTDPSPAPEARPAASQLSASSTTTVESSNTTGAAWLSDATVRQSFETWLAAQNQLKFAQYSQLYASRFTGTKRVGERTMRFGRETWLADREGMFKPGLRVEATDVEVAVAGPTVAQVTFLQRFATPRFSDQGKKRLLFTMEGDGLRITTEEMLDSTVAFAVATNEEPVWLVDDGVLRTRETLPKDAVAQPADYSSKDGVYTVEVALTRGNLPPAATTWLGRPLTLLTASGKFCPIELDAPRVRADVVPHFGMVGEWKGQDGATPASRSEITKQVWELSDDQVPLTFTVRSSCGATGVAVPAGPQEPRLLPPQKPPSKLVDWARQRFVDLPEIQALRAESPAGWPAARDVRVHVFEAPSGERWVLAAAGFPAECALVRGVTVVYELAEGEEPKVKQRYTTTGEPIDPIGLLWAVGNRPPVVVTAPRDVAHKQELWRLEGKGTLRPLFALQYFDCPC